MSCPASTNCTLHRVKRVLSPNRCLYDSVLWRYSYLKHQTVVSPFTNAYRVDGYDFLFTAAVVLADVNRTFCLPWHFGPDSSVARGRRCRQHNSATCRTGSITQRRTINRLSVGDGHTRKAARIREAHLLRSLNAWARFRDNACCVLVITANKTCSDRPHDDLLPRYLTPRGRREWVVTPITSAPKCPWYSWPAAYDIMEVNEFLSRTFACRY